MERSTLCARLALHLIERTSWAGSSSHSKRAVVPPPGIAGTLLFLGATSVRAEEERLARLQANLVQMSDDPLLLLHAGDQIVRPRRDAAR